MQNRQLPYTIPSAATRYPTVREVEEFGAAWLFDCEIRQATADTLYNRRFLINKFVWFMLKEDLAVADTVTIRRFLGHVTRAHLSEEGRWGIKRLKTPVKPETIRTYHRILGTFFGWCCQEEPEFGNPLRAVAAPISRPDEIQPFSAEQQQSLIDAARLSPHPRRDELIVKLLLDTGMRVSELAGIRPVDIDVKARSVKINGKGGKSRTVYYGLRTVRTLWNYLRKHDIGEDQQLFRADRGRGCGEPLQPDGILQMVRRLGKAANITSVRCSPHTFRHTFAVEFLRNGGNQFTLMRILGHTNVRMTARYVEVAQADVARQQREKSPVDRLGR